MERNEPAPPSTATGPSDHTPSWVSLKDEDLLALRICDLGVRIEGSELEARVAQFYEELGARGLTLWPVCYLGDEWFSPAGVPAIAIPFYLAHPRLKALELRQMLEVEGGTGEWCLQLLRHECGHAIDHAYCFSSRRDWHKVFGSPHTEYTPDTYRPRPYSKSFVRHLDNWYAQAHPDEDFAETFAVWLTMSPEEWRQRYRGWKALDKLEYVDGLMKESAHNPPAVTAGRRLSEASKRGSTCYLRGRGAWRRIGGAAHASEPGSPDRVDRALDGTAQVHGEHVGAPAHPALPAAQAIRAAGPGTPALRAGCLPRCAGHQPPAHRQVQKARVAMRLLER
ncbi:MAG: putative zinc-binding metallopeptidase [Acidobacteria bacterium]|nr:putative zinc-binding metallopeptidase [Acidobacteriota bacterium]